MEAFIEICKTDAEKYGTIADTREPSANQTAPSVFANTSSSAIGSSSNNGGSTGSSTGGSSSSEGSLLAGWIPDDQLPPANEVPDSGVCTIPSDEEAGDGSALVGNYDIH